MSSFKQRLPSKVGLNRLGIIRQARLIAFPCISTGRFRFSIEKAATTAVQTAKDAIAHSNITEIYFVCFDEQNFSAYVKELSIE